MATMMWDSLQNKILTLPDDVMVHPAHGAGSPCGKGLSTVRSMSWILGAGRGFHGWFMCGFV